MRAETDGQAEGWVIESTAKERGRVATVLVRRGTLRPGDVIVAGHAWARVRTLRNEADVELDAAAPGTPVEVDGWRGQPQAGDEMLQADDETQAKQVVDYRDDHGERVRMAVDVEAVNETRKLDQERREREREDARRMEEMAKDEAAAAAAAAAEAAAQKAASAPSIREVNFVVKGDVSGSVEAVVNSISALGNGEVRARVLRSSVGPVSEWDVAHASAAGGHVVSFNTDVDPGLTRLAEAQGVSILSHDIIYRLVDDVKARLSEHLAPNVTQRVTGEADVAQIFDINIRGRLTKPVAGCKVRNGIIARTARARVVRGGEVIYDGAYTAPSLSHPGCTGQYADDGDALGTLVSLKNGKKDVPDMRKGGECGLAFADEWTAFQVGDVVQCYDEKIEKRFL